MTAPWFDRFAAAIERGEPFHRRCEDCGHAGLPPRRTCPDCGEPAMTDAPLSTQARVVSFTDIHVSTPKFADQTPYTVVIAAFDEGVRLTGQLRGTSAVAKDDSVTLDVERPGDDDWLITFRAE